MMINTGQINRILVLSVSLLFTAVGCGTSNNAVPQLDESVEIHVYSPLTGNCVAMDDSNRIAGRGSEGGGGGGNYKGPGRMRAETTCTSFSFDVSGSCYGCDAMLIEADGLEASVDVDSNGLFNFAGGVASLGELTLTPMLNGVLAGDSYFVSLAAFELEDPSILLAP